MIALNAAAAGEAELPLATSSRTEQPGEPAGPSTGAMEAWDALADAFEGFLLGSHVPQGREDASDSPGTSTATATEQQPAANGATANGWGPAAADRWDLVLPPHILMQHPHYEEEAQNWHVVPLALLQFPFDLHKPAALRIHLHQPSPMWDKVELRHFKCISIPQEASSCSITRLQTVMAHSTKSAVGQDMAGALQVRLFSARGEQMHPITRSQTVMKNNTSPAPCGARWSCGTSSASSCRKR